MLRERDNLKVDPDKKKISEDIGIKFYTKKE